MFAVKWAGRFVERIEDRDAADKFARLILRTVGDWTPECRRLHSRITITDEATKKLIREHSVTDEMKRLERISKEARPKPEARRRSREHA